MSCCQQVQQQEPDELQVLPELVLLDERVL